MEEALKGSPIEKKISKIREMTSKQLQEDVNENFSKLLKKHRPAFVLVLKKME